MLSQALHRSARPAFTRWMAEKPAIAICEDDPDVRELLAAYLGSKGFKVSTARHGAELDRILATRSIALIILDWALPGENGLSICQRLHSCGGPPVIMLTAREEDVDRVEGLDGGADDYVSKPFNPRVLLARINAILRRTDPTSADEQLSVADLIISPAARIVIGPGRREVSLTSAEFDLLLCMVRSPQRVLSRDQLLDFTKGRSGDVFDRAIDMQVSRLRRRLEDAGSEVAGLIRTVRNAGYMLAAPVRRQ